MITISSICDCFISFPRVGLDFVSSWSLSKLSNWFLFSVVVARHSVISKIFDTLVTSSLFLDAAGLVILLCSNSCFRTVLLATSSIGCCCMTQNAQENLMLLLVILCTSSSVYLAHILCHYSLHRSHWIQATCLILLKNFGGSSCSQPRQLSSFPINTSDVFGVSR